MAAQVTYVVTGARNGSDGGQVWWAATAGCNWPADGEPEDD